jgi:hypothetical protein
LIWQEVKRLVKLALREKSWIKLSKSTKAYQLSETS